MSFRKQFESSLRSFRSYLLPSHRRTAKMMRQKATPLPKDKPLCVMDFTSIRIDNVSGRYLHHLVTEFEAAGYHIVYTDRFRFLATFQQKACKRLLLTHPFSIVPTSELPEPCDVFITDTETPLDCQARKNIVIDYEHYRPSPDSMDQATLPFFVHPTVQESGQVEAHTTSGAANSAERLMRIFFAGNTKTPKYDAPVLAEKYHVLSRAKVLHHAEESLAPDQIRFPQDFATLLPETASCSLTVATTQTCRIPNQQWIETLTNADFFLACPGVEMPLCHNLIEALAAGAIPILQYPQYLTPALTHGVNCLTFDSSESLAQVINKALTMPQEEINTLRQGALDYYTRYLQPGKFAQTLLGMDADTVRLFVNGYRVPTSGI